MNLRTISIAITAALLLPLSADAAPIPRGFRLVDRAPGVEMYAKRREYVQVLSASGSAKLQVLQGPLLEQGIYATFPRRTVGEWWNRFSESGSAFSLVNGQFFDPTDPDIATLAFSVKFNGMVYEGYADTIEYPNQKRLLILYPGRTVIMDYDDDPGTLERLPADTIITGLSSKAKKSPARGLPRTFIAVTKTGDTLIFSSSMASQNSANRVLRMFGADPEQVMMLDGGQSAHLIHQGKVLVPATARGIKPSREALPQVIGVITDSPLRAAENSDMR